jgi:ankyrin repeat protein
MHNPQDNCQCSIKPSSVAQTLDEMDFDRSIHNAANNGDFGRVKHLLLVAKQPVDAIIDGYTALSYACRKGNAEIVQLLLSNGANPNHLTGLKRSCLFRAALGDYIEVGRMLLEAGADPDATEISEIVAMKHLTSERREEWKRMLNDRSKLD